MLNKIIFICFAFCCTLTSCNKEDEAKKGLDPTIENLAGTWTLQKTERYWTNANGDTTQPKITYVVQPNSTVYVFKNDLQYTLTTRSVADDGTTSVSNNSGSFEIVEDTWDGAPAKFIDFNFNQSRKENLIQYIDSDYLEIWNFGESYGSYSYTTDFYVKIK
jgi:hypothetical protein